MGCQSGASPTEVDKSWDSVRALGDVAARFPGASKREAPAGRRVAGIAGEAWRSQPSGDHALAGAPIVAPLAEDPGRRLRSVGLRGAGRSRCRAVHRDGLRRASRRRRGPARADVAAAPRSTPAAHACTRMPRERARGGAPALRRRIRRLRDRADDHRVRDRDVEPQGRASFGPRAFCTAVSSIHADHRPRVEHVALRAAAPSSRPAPTSTTRWASRPAASSGRAGLRRFRGSTARFGVGVVRETDAVWRPRPRSSRARPSRPARSGRRRALEHVRVRAVRPPSVGAVRAEVAWTKQPRPRRRALVRPRGARPASSATPCCLASAALARRPRRLRRVGARRALLGARRNDVGCGRPCGARRTAVRPKSEN